MADARLISARLSYYSEWEDWAKRDAANDALLLVEKQIKQETFEHDMRELERVGFIYGKAKFSRA